MAALFIDDDLGVGHVVSEPLAMLARHEHVGQAVDDPGRDGRPRNAPAMTASSRTVFHGGKLVLLVEDIAGRWPSPAWSS